MVSRKRPEFLYLNGDIVPYADAKVHVLTTAFKYAASVFEGIRAYWSDARDDLFVFRLTEHLDRLVESARVARIELAASPSQMRDALLELIRRNGLKEDLHIRILAFVGEDDGLLDSTGPAGLMIAAMPMGRFPDPTGDDGGLKAGISHWHRISDSSMPPRIKATSNYMNSRLALLQARHEGYDDAILVDSGGKVTEGPGWNIFVVRRGEVITPPVTQGILEGVTRDSLCRLFPEVHGVEVLQRVIDKTELYVAEEAFFCGSGKEVRPISSIDGFPLGSGSAGPRTREIRETYFSVARGERDEYRDWLLSVYH